MSTIVTARFSARPVSHFPALDSEAPTILVTIAHDGNTYVVHTNLGADLTAEGSTAAVGYALHKLAHALLSGETVDLSGLDEPIPNEATS